MAFKNIGLIIKHDASTVKNTADHVYSYLQKKDCSILLDESAENIISCENNGYVSRNYIGENCDLVIVIGGDGTFLNATRSLAFADVPLVGINVGRLGFLVDISPENIETSLDKIFSGDYLKEERILLTAEIQRDNKSVFSANAFNDVVVHIRDVARMMEYETCINKKYINHQRADGLIIATPTGSTAYSLSCGGPLLNPKLDAITLVPISPHTLSNRPIVVNSDSEIDVLICETKQAIAQVTCDGQTSFDLNIGDHLIVRKHTHLITLLHPPGHDHYHTLREKLHWSEHP